MWDFYFPPFHSDIFYILKGNRLRIYSESKVVEKTLSRSDIHNIITRIFNFNLTGLKFDH